MKLKNYPEPGGIRFVEGWGKVIVTARPSNIPGSIVVLAADDVYLVLGTDHLKLRP